MASRLDRCFKKVIVNQGLDTEETGPCNRFRYAHPCGHEFEDGTEQDTLETLKERILWWQNDVAYKAPEQIDLQYVFRLLNMLNSEVVTALTAAPATEPVCDLSDGARCSFYRAIADGRYEGLQVCRNHDDNGRLGHWHEGKAVCVVCQPAERAESGGE